ncbi:winged helix-turn-helix transcriptional regulator [Lentzea sp. NPDC042327]|uniref:Lrp/AsnC family transcriptional regulator n=1 Tax=Lentzea sp. NPDC042327 TaxID=3154801 RepID=UPI0033F463BD
MRPRPGRRCARHRRPGARDRAEAGAIAEQDGRISNAELADRVGLSPSPCLRRIRRLEEIGVIHGYRVVVGPAAVGRSRRLRGLPRQQDRRTTQRRGREQLRHDEDPRRRRPGAVPATAHGWTCGPTPSSSRRDSWRERRPQRSGPEWSG